MNSYEVDLDLTFATNRAVLEHYGSRAVTPQEWVEVKNLILAAMPELMSELQTKGYLVSHDQFMENLMNQRKIDNSPSTVTVQFYAPEPGVA